MLYFGTFGEVIAAAFAMLAGVDQARISIVMEVTHESRMETQLGGVAAALS